VSIDFSATEWVSYDVAGTTLADAAAAIAHLPEAGQTEWWPHYDFQTDEHGHVTDVTLAVATRVTLPNWSGHQSASAAEQREWDRFAAALQAHEQGHLELVVSHLNGLDQQMLGVPHDHAQGIYHHAQQQLQAASDAYDQQTNHGQSTGTVIDLSVVPVASP
jgi:predicted secreted Zn-dependent protease